MKQELKEKSLWEPIVQDQQTAVQSEGKSLSYWGRIIRRFFRYPLSLIGILVTVTVIVAALFGPEVTGHEFDKMELELRNLPPRLELYQLDDNSYLYLHKEFYFLRVTPEGEILEKISGGKDDFFENTRAFQVDGHEILIDFDGEIIEIPGRPARMKAIIYLDGEVFLPTLKVWNRTFRLGTDNLGRDVLTRTLLGARTSVIIAAAATLINSIIGIFYGGIAGYCGGLADNLMMRWVDILSTIPTTLIVIMLMVVIGPGIKTLIIAMGIANWTTMARIVRSQVLTLKEREFILAAKAANGNGFWILTKHLIPNAAASIIVCMTMMVPGAIFSESFLSFIGLGVSAPSTSWGTLVSEGLTGFRSFPYQLIIPAVSICITILALNFVGNGIQKAINPYEGR